MKFVMAMAFVFSIGIASEVMSDDTTLKQKVNEVSKDSERGANKVIRKTKDETCHLVNGKMECAAKKVKHTIQNGADNVEDAID